MITFCLVIATGIWQGTPYTGSMLVNNGAEENVSVMLNQKVYGTNTELKIIKIEECWKVGK